ncbi:MAG: hypothetical protein R2874_15470 [Desulfobacterales bacterium]
MDAYVGFVQTKEKKIAPLLAIGVAIAAGFLLGRPGHPGLIPGKIYLALVGGNSLWANLFCVSSRGIDVFCHPHGSADSAGTVGFRYGAGTGLALLLAGPACHCQT